MVITNTVNEQIDGAFVLNVEFRFDDLRAYRQKVFDFADANGSSRILLGQQDGTDNLEFVIVQGGQIYRIVAESALTQGALQSFQVGIDLDGVMRIVAGDTIIAEGRGVVPLDVERDLSFVGRSTWPGDNELVGDVTTLTVANYASLAELAGLQGTSQYATLAGAQTIVIGQQDADYYDTFDAEGDGEISGVQALSVIPIHSMVLPDGKVLSFGATSAFPPDGRFVYSIFDPETGVEKILPNTTEVNIFCSHMALDPLTGNVIIMGGDNVYVEGGGFEEDGVHDVLIFDYKTQTMQQAPEGNLQFGRYYGSTANLADGDILIVGGIDSGYKGATFAEVYSSQTGIRTLTGAEMPELDDAYQGGDWYYPHLFVATDGRVLVVEANGNEMYWMTTDGTGTVQKIGATGFESFQLSASITYGIDKVALLGSDGGIYVADISQDVPVWTRVAELDQARTNAALVQMADGRVAVVGGNAAWGETNPPDGVNAATLEIEIWDPVTNTVELLDEANGVPRLYHSSAILLADGTIWTGGGGAPGPIANANVEIYAPDYLYGADGGLADRPEILSAPSNIEAGQTFTIQVDDSSAIARMTAVKSGSYTHTRNADSRFFDLDFTVVDGTTISVSTPPKAAMLPGAYMLFALNGAGTPSQSSMLGVDMVDLVETPNLTPEDSVFEYYNIDYEDIDGAFSLSVEARFDDLGLVQQKVFDFSAPVGEASRILMGQFGDTASMEFVIVQGGQIYRIIAENALVEGEFAKWTVGINGNGQMSIAKNGTVLATGQGVVPQDIDRSFKFIGESPAITDDRFDGVIRNLEVTNQGDAPASGVFYFDGSYYQRGSDGLTYEQALAEATALGGKLLEVDSRAESDFVTAIFNDGRNPIWLGISDAADEGVWRNSDGSLASFTNWLPGQPNNEFGANGGQNYAAIVTADGRWDDFYNTNSAFNINGQFVSAETRTIIEFDAVAPDPVEPDPVEPDASIRFGNSTYELGTQGLTWEEAQAEARERGGKLVEIDSQAENDFILQTFGDGTNSIFVGFSDAANEGVWVGADGEEATFVNWLPGQPDNSGAGQDYARIASTNGRWDDGETGQRAFRDGDGPWNFSATSISVIEFEDEPEFVFEGSRYELGTAGLTWEEAQAEARDRGGRLVEINSQAENDYVLQTFGDGQSSIYIGLSDAKEEGVWVGADGQEATFVNWLLGQPDNSGGGQDYARIASTNGQWDDGENYQSAFKVDNGPWDLGASSITVIEFALTDAFVM